MKYLTKRTDGRWQGSKTVNGKRIFVYAKTQQECLKKLRQLEKEIKTHKAEPKKLNFYEFALYWLNTYKKEDITENTFKIYQYVINAHLKITTPINCISTQELQELLNNLPATRIRKEVQKIIRMVVRKAYELDYVKKDISSFLTIGKIKKPETRALTLEEQTLLLSNLTNDTFSHRVLIYLVTGIRPAEITKIDQAETNDKYVKVNGTKTDKATRWIKVSPTISRLIKSLPKEAFCFDTKRFRQKLQKFCSSIGINYNVTIYTLRHTFATNLYILGVREKDRQTYMGHVAGSKVTNDVYTTFSPDISPSDIYSIYGDFLPKF